MNINWLAIFVAAFIPTVIGFLWYNPKVFGNAWMKAAEMTDEKIKNANMLVIFGVSLILSLMLSLAMNNWSIHQMNVPGVFHGDSSQEATAFLQDFAAKYGDRYRTFSHGSVHGLIAGFFIALPILGTNALFERKGFKYIAVNAGYWIVTLAIMGGLICAWV